MAENIKYDQLMGEKGEDAIRFLRARHTALLQDRSEWEDEWKDISDFLVPGRGVYSLFTKPPKRKLVSKKIINTAGREALRVLTSGLQGGLTSPSRPWFQLQWTNKELNEASFYKNWMYEAQEEMYYALATSGFYQIMHSFYTEIAGFGTGSIFAGEGKGSALNFNILTAGEYVFDVDEVGIVHEYYRVLFYSGKGLIDEFGMDNLPTQLKIMLDDTEEKKADALNAFYTVVHAVVPKSLTNWGSRPFTSVYYLEDAQGTNKENMYKTPLRVSGYHEFPYPTGRWDIIGSDRLGLGPGSESLPDVKRLQEVDKSFLISTHKASNPPLNVPAKMKGHTNTRPGGMNYYASHEDIIIPLQNMRFDYQGVLQAMEHIENHIRKTFFNDVFMTGSRDPNASPMKARQVEEISAEKMMRLGPVIERLQFEIIQPILTRVFNILYRRGRLPEMNEEQAQRAGNYEIKIISPLAQAQKALAAQQIQQMLQMVGGLAQFNPNAMDKIDTDRIIDEYQDITGAPMAMMATVKEVRDKRAARQQRMQEQQQQQTQMAQLQVQKDMELKDAQAAKARSESVATMAEVSGAIQ